MSRLRAVRRRTVCWSIFTAALASGITVVGLTPLLAVPERQTLWRVVQACVADFKLTGAAFPCLQVNLSEGETRGYVVLRPPFGPEDLILAPTRRVIGIEDPFLQSPDSPNYFDSALRARSFLKGPDGRPPRLSEIAVGVNAAAARTQDQLHIHIGCLAPATKRALTAIASKLQVGRWTPPGNLASVSPPWVQRIGTSDLEGVNPFRLAAEGLLGKVGNRARLTITVTRVRIAAEDDLVILATSGTFTAEGIIDPTCLGRSSVSDSN